MECVIQCYIQLGGWGIDDGRPSCLRRQIVGAIRKGSIVKKCRSDIFIVRVKPPLLQYLTKFLYPIFIFSPMKRRNTSVSIISRFSKKEPEFRAPRSMSLHLKRIASRLMVSSFFFFAISFPPHLPDHTRLRDMVGRDQFLVNRFYQHSL